MQTRPLQIDCIVPPVSFTCIEWRSFTSTSSHTPVLCLRFYIFINESLVPVLIWSSVIWFRYVYPDHGHGRLSSHNLKIPMKWLTIHRIHVFRPDGIWHMYTDQGSNYVCHQETLCAWSIFPPITYPCHLSKKRDNHLYHIYYSGSQIKTRADKGCLNFWYHPTPESGIT